MQNPLFDRYLTDTRSAEEFSPEDQHLIELLAAHAGVAIENARLHSRIQSLTVVEERQRIGMDLHDGIIQSIYAVGLTLEFAKADVAEGQYPSAEAQINHAMEALNATIRTNTSPGRLGSKLALELGRRSLPLTISSDSSITCFWSTGLLVVASVNL